mgnify:CR=1 FL=1
MVMCYEPTSPKHREKDYVMPPRDPNIVIYYYEVEKKDVKCFRVAEYEDVYVICPRGEIKIVDRPGFYEVISTPAKIVWIRSSKFILTVGVPKGILPGGIGINADISLYLQNPDMFIGNIITTEKEGKITLVDIKNELRKLLENAARNIQIDPKIERKQLVANIHDEMNNLIRRTWLGGFVCDVQSVGFSFECELSKLLDELAR